MTIALGTLGLFASVHPGRPRREYQGAAVLLAALCTGTLLLFFVASWLVAPRSTLAQGAYLGVYVVSAALCCVAARSRTSDGVRWELMAAAVISVPIAIVVDPRGGTTGDLIALAFYPAAAIAVAPRGRADGSTKPALEFIDVVLLATGAITIATYAVLLLLGGAGSSLTGLYRPLAPAAALLVMLPGVSRFKAHDRFGRNASAVFLFSGLVLSIATDVSTAGPQMSRVTWSMAVWLVAIGAMVAVRSSSREHDVSSAPTQISWWPAAAAGGVYALLASQLAGVEPVSSRILIIGGTVATGLLVVRQIAALHENQRLLERVARHEKRDAVGRAAAHVAHEFNNLLTAMVGHIDIVGADLPSDHPGHASIQELRRATTNAADLTRSLLGNARQAGSAAEVVDVNAIVHQVASMLRPSLGDGYDVHVRHCDGPCLACGDKQELFHAVLNLALNARDAMPHGGLLAIETSTVSAASLPATLPLAGRDHVCIAVRDTGVGMTDEVMARAFDPFFTTKAEGKGTGLGLALVFSTVRQNGGVVDVTSVPGRGSTFTVWLPQEHTT
jgi:signal transduction histidine kinase